MPFLPTTPAELSAPPDFVLVTGDAYVDHPSFGAAVIGRVLESAGYSVAVLAQPDWRSAGAFKVFGQPSLGFLVTGGNIDSMVNHYTVARKRRAADAYSPGGRNGLRPDRATIVYGNRVREAYHDTAIILGGLEASLRRLAHYDYWDNKVRRSILLDAAADLLVYGMGERAILEIAACLRAGKPAAEITGVCGTVYAAKALEKAGECLLLPDFDVLRADKTIYAQSFMLQYGNTDSITARPLAEGYAGQYVIQNPPAPPLSQQEFDRVSSLPYERAAHPMYDEQGGVPALEEVRFSLIASRGCFGGCHFCALTFHQGRVVQGRSAESLVAEAKALTGLPGFAGYIHDVGGPTANFIGPACDKQMREGVCLNRACMTPRPCKRLKVDHKKFMSTLRRIRELPRVKKVFVRSGIRYDYMLLDPCQDFWDELVTYHISGQLKIAPEHVSPRVLDLMGKPRREVYDRFVRKYTEVNQKLGLRQFIVPYLMSSHPGSDLAAAVELAEYLRDMKISPQQVQDFYPTPGTLSTCMYYTGFDPRDRTPVHVPDPHEKAMQRALLQYRLPRNYLLVKEALTRAGRTDLIGFGPKCLIRPRQGTGRDGGNEKKPAAPVHGKKKTIRNVHKKKG